MERFFFFFLSDIHVLDVDPLLGPVLFKICSNEIWTELHRFLIIAVKHLSEVILALQHQGKRVSCTWHNVIVASLNPV